MSNSVHPHREILRLAVPAFLTLVAEPLFLLADSAIVGHLGTVPLAGLGVASAALLTAANIFVFLAYGTTSVVARQIGAGRPLAALSAGLDGVWLATVIGAGAALVLAVFARPICSAFGASPEVLDQATIYVRVSALGLPAMLVVLAATGVLRGFQDTRTPLVAAVAGFGVNVVLNYLLVYPAGMGIAGAAWGTVIAQTGMATGLLIIVVRRARREGASLRPHPGRVLHAAWGGLPLLVRTLALRAAFLLTTWVAAGFGDAPLAAHQVALTIFGFLAFALDALAIAGQALTGKSLGAGDVAGTKEATRIMLWWGWWAGVVLGGIILALHQVLPRLFSPDEAVRDALAAALVVVALGQPIAGLVFVLDGVLIGAGDGFALAVVQVAVLVAYLPVLLLVRAHTADGGIGSLQLLWWSFTAFMAFRLIALWLRARTDRWLVVGA
ncbi:MATE family efflux transporter [Demetria terragena]|uniref:MATE family efflux transporter n=1 Tax=Demetria terragena TaxID=63959 RepID=UPI000476ECB2|nr:MATE family efflux transporter [Demetria terragena]